MPKPVAFKKFADMSQEERAVLRSDGQGRLIVAEAQSGAVVWRLFSDGSEEVRRTDGTFAVWPS